MNSEILVIVEEAAQNIISFVYLESSIRNCKENIINCQETVNVTVRKSSKQENIFGALYEGLEMLAELLKLKLKRRKKANTMKHAAKLDQRKHKRKI